jgi:hypothetical protein
MAIETGQATEEFSPLPYVENDPDETWDELPGRPVRKPLGPFTVVLCACLLVAGAFFAGVKVEKGHVKASSGSGISAASIAALRSAFTGGAAATGASGATGAAGGGAASAFGAARAGNRGTIALIDGNNVYITETGGTVVKATTSPGTTFSVTTPGTISSLHPGDEVTVIGPTNSDGIITATAVTDSGAGGTASGFSRATTGTSGAAGADAAGAGAAGGGGGGGGGFGGGG